MKHSIKISRFWINRLKFMVKCSRCQIILNKRKWTGIYELVEFYFSIVSWLNNDPQSISRVNYVYSTKWEALLELKTTNDLLSNIISFLLWNLLMDKKESILSVCETPNVRDDVLMMIKDDWRWSSHRFNNHCQKISISWTMSRTVLLFSKIDRAIC